MSIKLTQEEKDLIKKNKQFIIDGDWDGFFQKIEITEISNIFQFCLECVPDLLYKITKIPDQAFYGSDIKSITIPSNIKEIGERAFESCTSLKSISIPNSVREIGWRAFCDCYNLTHINIPDSVTEIGDCAFFDCTSLKSITISDSVTEIGRTIFYKCYNLKRISIPKHLDGKTFLVGIPKDCEIEVRS